MHLPCSAYNTKFFANKLMYAFPDIPWHVPTKPLSRTGREQIKWKKPMSQDKVSLIKQI